MADLYASIADVNASVQTQLADILDMRAAQPQHRAMCADFLATIPFPPEASVLEIGCGTGSITCLLAEAPGVATTVGVDPSSVFIARAQALHQRPPQLLFQQGDGRVLPFAPETFDVVVLYTAENGDVYHPARTFTTSSIHRHTADPTPVLVMWDRSYVRAVRMPRGTWGPPSRRWCAVALG